MYKIGLKIKSVDDEAKLFSIELSIAANVFYFKMYDHII